VRHGQNYSDSRGVWRSGCGRISDLDLQNEEKSSSLTSSLSSLFEGVRMSISNAQVFVHNNTRGALAPSADTLWRFEQKVANNPPGTSLVQWRKGVKRNGRRTADHPCKSTSSKKCKSPHALATARTSPEQDLELASIPLGGGSCHGSTAHPFIASGPVRATSRSGKFPGSTEERR
jgi:hypothetical protein